MKKFAYALFLLILGWSCSNKGNTSNPPPLIIGLMPLAVGNYWNYTKIGYDSNSGNPIDTSADAIHIIGQVSVDSLTYFQQYQNSILTNGASFFYNLDSNTLRKVDGSTSYVFFKRVSTDSSFIDSWPDTVTTSRCMGTNTLYGFTGTTDIDGYNCLRNVDYVSDCTGMLIQTWVYYMFPNLGLVRIQHYVVKQDHTIYLDFEENLVSQRIQQ
jgi:hypothetical protein